MKMKFWRVVMLSEPREYARRVGERPSCGAGDPWESDARICRSPSAAAIRAADGADPTRAMGQV